MNNEEWCKKNCPYSTDCACDGVCNFVLSLLKEQEDALEQMRLDNTDLRNCNAELMKAQEAVVHPESSCEMTYITDCCCDLCGIQLIREDNFCRCCGKRIEWEGR